MSASKWRDTDDKVTNSRRELIEYIRGYRIMSKQKNDRQTNLTRGIRVEIASLVYNLIEVVVSVTVGLLTGSAALVSWGLDSTVEATSAGTLIWRLKAEKDGGDKRTVLHRKKVALYVVACAFWIVVAAILYEAVSAFISQEAPGFNWWGIAILFVSLVVNPLLAWGKYRYGKRLDSPALKYDAKDTMICEYQTVVVLAGIGLTQWMGWWWADPVAALLIVPYVAWEAFEATKDARSVDPDEAEVTADA
ncbi:cation diffusion facilitator family transporter [Sulfitobacter pontiacus]|jgi:cation diffusion facilitator family transporter|uniref:Cation diffusion facilitator family transporter n=2 Tax=Rhodobacterales TaxID=204455 RepID=A0A1H3CR44_9RHOB|nr:cation diffusion facilitator family transporter [Sulfitobacter pontiacus]